VPPSCCHLTDHNSSPSTSKASSPGLQRRSWQLYCLKLGPRQLPRVDSKHQIMPNMEEQSRLPPSPSPHNSCSRTWSEQTLPDQGVCQPCTRRPARTHQSLRSSSFSVAPSSCPKQQLLTGTHHCSAGCERALLFRGGF